MDLKKGFKAFFTLKRRANDGFTLVELIVVIAILAILGGVAVPAYSGYVKKANMQADITLASEVEQALNLYYYGHLDTEGGYVTLSTSGAEASNDEIKTAMTAVFGDNWEETCKLKYDGWTNSKNDITAAIAGSNFSDGNGGVNMDLLGAVDNLTGQLSGVMDSGALSLESVPGYQSFLSENGIDPSDTQLAANAAVLYLSQSSMESENREKMTALLANGVTWGYTEGEMDLGTNFMEKAVTQGCTQFEALAMAYVTMQGYCMQRDSENGTTEWADALAAIDLTKTIDGKDVTDEGQVLRKLCAEFSNMVDEDDRAEFTDYLDDGYAAKDIAAYYGVIDGISENQEIFMEKLNGEKGFYASQQSLLKAWWDTDIESGEVAVCLTVANDAPQTWHTGMNESD